MGTDPLTHTPAELMVAASAREIRDRETVFVGMRLPLLGFLVARSLHAPGATGIYEVGVVRDEPAPVPIMTMADLPNLSGATWLCSTSDMMGMLQRGRVDVSFIGGAQVDRYGNLNTSYIGNSASPDTRLPGSGGACDLACLARRHIIVMAHRRHRFVEKVDYITSPGYGTGRDWRRRQGLPGGGPATVITDKGILRFEDPSREMVLVSIHPGVTLDEIRRETGWDLKVSPALCETPLPTQPELSALRMFDPDRFWTA